MATRMLIDARHPEETRVAVLKGNRIEEFDFESAEHKQIKGNIYLAKVTRVEPSLQAAFVDFGGNRHGFLAFSEIHPDYYQIPQQDRDDLLAEEQAHAEEEAALRAAEEEEDGEEPIVEEIDTSEQDDVATIEDGHVEGDSDDGDDSDEDDSDDDSESDSDEDGESSEDGDDDSESDDDNSRGRGRGRGGRGRGRRQGRGQQGRNQGRGNGRRGGGRSRAKEIDEVRAKRQALRRRYKIQDVIQRRQVLLVQVVKEERGNKGAALTSYLSLAGRYCVLMPNSSSGGGISRKISNGSDRKRLKQIVSDLSLPKSMGLIVRTAGLQRTKTEIKRDFDYLARVWDEIREKTLSSAAPNLVHSDSDLIKRAIRDIYNREIEEVIVEGEDGYKAAKQFMKLLMPSHARRVKNYSDAVPMFQRYGAEDQLSAMYDPVVQLKSGGYLVINPTEALVSIDINSGRSTKEHGIEQTALATNLESAREIARQLRLRDMAGLVVIDFIDMEHNSNVRKVERCMKDALKNDRARIQVGRISGFGLMEMSRQRLRTGVLEATSRECPHCDGTGLVRTASSAGLSALRSIEEEAAKGKGTTITLLASTEAAVYLLNSKRADLAGIEARYGVNVAVVPEGEDEGAKMTVQSSGPRPTSIPKFEPIIDDEEDEELPPEEDEEGEGEVELDEDGEPRKKRRRRRRGGRGRNRNRDREDGDEGEDREDSQPARNSDEGSDQERETRDGDDSEGEEDRPKRRRRRGGRGRGRNRNRENGENQNAEGSEDNAENGTSEAPAADGNASTDTPEEASSSAEQNSVEEEKKPKPRTRRKKAEKPADESESSNSEASAEDGKEETEPKPRTRRKPSAAKAKADAAKAKDSADADDKAASDEAKPAPKKRAPRRKKADISEGEEKSTDNAKPAAKAKPKAKASTAKKAAPAKPKAKAKAKPSTSKAAEADDAKTAAPSDTSGGDAGDETDGPRRGGWWQRTFGA